MRHYSGFLWIALIASATASSVLLAGCGVKPTQDDVAPAPVAAAPPAKPRDKSKSKSRAPAAALEMTAVDLSDAVRPVVLSGGVEISAAKNEWTSFALHVGRRVPGAAYSIRIGTLPAGAGVEAYQVLSMPVDVNRAGYVRHTGQDAARGELPRALIPLRVRDGGTIDLAGLRDASRPADPSAPAPPAEPALVWVDLRVPPGAAPGDFAAACEAIANEKVVASVALKLTVHDFALPAERNLQLVGRLNWDDLERLYPDRFEAIRPRLMNRNEERYAGAVRTIDSLISLAQRHRTAVVVPRLQPTVKWPAGAPPEVTWDDFDSLVAPWLTGEAFEDRMPLGFWPLPAPDMLEQFKRASQLEYWANAATHFDQNDWLDRAPVWVEKVTPGRATDPEAKELSRMAAETLALDHRVRVAVPLEADQLRFIDGGAAAARPAGAAAAAPPPGDGDGARPAAAGMRAAAATLLDPASTPRLWSAAPALVFAPPMRLWPEGTAPPMHYLRSNMPALVPYVGAGGDERDVRLWAWLAFLRQASLINFSDVLPSLDDPTDPADPNELIWFYPGEWFGLEEPVPTIQLKWLRRAQQDFEYLRLVRERGDRDTRLTALMMARLITKPVEIPLGQNPDPTYALMSGTTSQDAWNEARQLLTNMILLHAPGQAVNDARKYAVHIETLRWGQPQERPLLVGRTTQWRGEFKPGESKLRLRVGVDVYNASDAPQRPNLIGWSDVPRFSGWEIDAEPSDAPVLSTYNVRRATLDATFDLTKVTPAARRPMELTFTNGFDRRTAALKLALPVATSDRREGQRLPIDGKIENDWNPADLVQDGPLVKMLSRPSLQRQQFETSSSPAKVYTTWAAGHFYVAFDLAGISPAAVARAQNFVDYQFRRAWSEDLCEILIQPIDANGLPGPVLHVVCKPNGSTWVERKIPPAPGTTDIPAAGPAWQAVEAGILHASRTDGERWTGEVKIPWKAILDAAAPAAGEVAEPPALLRFNFVQHRTATGESASWSGPIDFGRDDSFMGVLYLRDPEEPRRPNVAGRLRDGDAATEER